MNTEENIVLYTLFSAKHSCFMSKFWRDLIWSLHNLLFLLLQVFFNLLSPLFVLVLPTIHTSTVSMFLLLPPASLDFAVSRECQNLQALSPRFSFQRFLLSLSYCINCLAVCIPLKISSLSQSILSSHLPLEIYWFYFRDSPGFINI